MHIGTTSDDPMVGSNITHRPHVAFRLARTAAALAAALALVVLALTQSKGRPQQRVKSLKGAAPLPAAAAAAAAVNGISGRALSNLEAGIAPGRLVRELIPRSGLPHVFSKARWDEGPVRVAFLDKKRSTPICLLYCDRGAHSFDHPLTDISSRLSRFATMADI